MIKENLIDENILNEIKEMDKKDFFPFNSIKSLSSHGILGMLIPKEYNGAGFSNVEYVQTLMEIASYSVTLGVILSVHNSVSAYPIYVYGTKEQKEKYLSKMSSGEWIGSFALTEPTSGSDATNISTEYWKEGDYYIINGRKIWITNSSASTIFLIFAKKKDGSSYKNITSFIVEKSYKGFKIGNKENKMGLNGSESMEIILDECSVPSNNILGIENEGFKIAMEALNGGRMGIASISTGAIKGILDYIKNNVDPSTPGYEKILSDIVRWYETSYEYVIALAKKKDEGKNIAVEASIAKSYSSKKAFEASSLLLNLSPYDCGYFSYPGRMFRDTKVLSIVEGTNEIQDRVISKRYFIK